MLLLIDTAQESGSVILASGDAMLFSEENKIAKEHATWLHEAISRLLEKAGAKVQDLKAVSVMAGPGSYTGLRVGMAAAKGLCYALKIPLITQNTLRVMAASMRAEAERQTAEIREASMPKETGRQFAEIRPAKLEEVDGHNTEIRSIIQKVPDGPNVLICPLIDARRDEVFTAVFDTDMQEILPPQALILDKSSFENLLSQKRIIFFGTGAPKLKNILQSPFALFPPETDIKQAFVKVSQHDFARGNWADPIYSELVYLKEFFSY